MNQRKLIPAKEESISGMTKKINPTGSIYHAPNEELPPTLAACFVAYRNHHRRHLMLA
jgi:hypothetical protein